MVGSLLILLFSNFVFAGDVSSAVLFQLDSARAQKLYTLDISVQDKDDGTHTLALFRGPDDAEVVREQGVIRGSQVLRYEIQQEQTGERGKFFVEADKIHFEYEGKGKKKSAEERVRGVILCTANFSAFVRENWAELVGGRAMDARFAVWDRLETVGFTLQKNRGSRSGR